MTFPLTGSARTGGNDAVAFTSGPQGAPFSAGVVHAWLAADREKPLVAAGISIGTVAAAAMRRVYEELEHNDNDNMEVKRWRWYQRYYQAVTNNPVGPLWAGLPDPVDFFSETPPAKDSSVPPSLLQESECARRHYYLLIKCGVWLANLPVRVSTIATLIVMYVRRREGYGVKFLTWLSFYRNFLVAILGVVFHLIRSPQWISENTFGNASKQKLPRPLVGWKLYVSAVLTPLIVAGLLGLIIWELHWIFASFVPGPVQQWSLTLCLIGVALIALDQWLFALVTAVIKPKIARREENKRSWLGRLLLKLVSSNLDITTGLLHPFEVKRAIFNLFVKGAPDFVLNGPTPDAMKALFVCAALQETDQIILKEDMPIVEALTAALSVPGVLPPQRVERKWISTTTKTTGLHFDVIDGAAVRTNPVPAFFDWCKRISDPVVSHKLERHDGNTPSLHVVYNVPTGYEGSVQDAPGIDCPDIVLSAQTALQLAKRRDTRQEVRQTNNLSRLEWHRQLVDSTSNKNFVIFADEIAPRIPIDLGNELSPDHDKLRKSVADGCRATLETLYADEIKVLSKLTLNVSCKTLISSIAPRRTSDIGNCSGLKAVCDFCSGMLEYRPVQKPGAVQEGILQTYGQRTRPSSEDLRRMFPQLATQKQKVVFLGSGGVFRGAFHIGVIAAISKTKLFPDLVVGASVGTLMGGALCRMTVGEEVNVPKVIGDLTTLFSNVDRKVSLTSTFKNAVKQLGIRAREIRLSPSELARGIRAGSKEDPGFAATGAPPALTDAISSLFVIPQKSTAAITAQFVAGHFSAAIARFLRELRRETLGSFDIRSCIMGVSLLENEARALLAFSKSGVELTKVQPYQGTTPSGRNVAFFGTTSYLNASSSMLLGRDFLTTAPSWNATEHGLCSSAFPAVFAARMEADLIPGAGRMDRFFADGGMFDNLPFFPALEVLSETQRSVPFKDAAEMQARVQERATFPALIISAGLNANAVPSQHFLPDTMFAVKNRAASLSYKSKTSTFSTSATKSLNILETLGEENLSTLSMEQLSFLNGFVAAAVVDITPTDDEHINPTFAFCKSLGLQSSRVHMSIADGCYRSLQEFSNNIHVQKALSATGRSVSRVSPAHRLKVAEEGLCPYFKIASQSLTCPFTETGQPEVSNVFLICKCDPTHL